MYATHNPQFSKLLPGPRLSVECFRYFQSYFCVRVSQEILCLQNLVAKFKLQNLPDNDKDHLTAEGYEQFLRESVLTPLQALKVGCIVVVLSGKAIWHEARTAHPHKGHQEALEVPNNSDVSSQLKVLLFDTTGLLH